MTPGGAKTLTVGELVMHVYAQLDLADNDLFLPVADYLMDALLQTINQSVALARNGGSWDGQGIMSSSARDDQSGRTGLVVVPTPGGVLVRYSWAADADGDRQVTADDYFRIDRGFIKRRTLFHEGDFNYNGVIDLEDYMMIDTIFLNQSPFA